MERNTWDLKQLRDMRLSRYWSQEELAELSGLSTRTIQRIERGHKVDIGSIKLLANAFEVGLNDLIGTDRTEQAEKEGFRNVKNFYIALAAAIVLIVSKLILAIYALEDERMVWVRFFVLTVVALFTLSFIAEKNLEKGVTIKFLNRIFGLNLIKNPSLSRKVSKYLGAVVGVVIVFMPIIIYMLLSES